MQYYVHKNNQQLGPFSPTDLRDRVQRGEFTSEDLGWHEGLANWTPLKNLIGGVTPAAPPLPVSAPAPAYAYAPAPTQTPTGLRVVTAIVVFGVSFIVFFILAFFIACLVCGGIVGMQAAAAEHAQGFAQGEAAGQKAGQEFGRTYAGLLFLGSAVFSLIVSALLSWKMAFSNLFPWCRAR